jgi:hypothetical protein
MAASCEANNEAPLYINVASAGGGVFEAVVSLLSRELFLTRAPRDVRSWLRDSLKHAAPARLVFLVDGWTAAEGQSAIESLHDFLRLCDDTGVPVILAVDSATWARIGYRNQQEEPTRIGRKAAVVELRPLDLGEAEEAELLAINLHAELHRSWSYNPDYREPRFLRLALSSAAHSEARIATEEEHGAMSPLTLIPPIATTNLLEELEARYLSAPEMESAYRALSVAVIDEMRRPPPRDRELDHSCWRRGIVLESLAREQVGGRLAALISAGHLRVADSPGGPVVIPLVPELVSVAAAHVLEERALERARKSDIGAIIEDLLLYAALLPAGEVAVALCLSRLPPEALAMFIERLRAMRLQAKKIAPDPELRTLLTAEMMRRAARSDAMRGLVVIENVWPALVLSHLAGDPAIDEVERQGEAVRLPLWWEIGSFGDVILPTPVSSPMSYHTHGLEGGAFLCWQESMIEPITWSMRRAFYRGRGDMRELARAALEHDRVFLALRLYHAAREASADETKDLAARAEEVTAMLEPYLQKRLGDSSEEAASFLSPRSE